MKSVRKRVIKQKFKRRKRRKRNGKNIEGEKGNRKIGQKK
jgi:hypothetical protein